MNQEFRYPGLASFTTEQRDLFFGRKRETRELFHLLSVEKTVVLFSKSGLGKTSLLNAGVIPLLAENRIWPVPIRFGTDVLAPEMHFQYQFEEAKRKFIDSIKPIRPIGSITSLEMYFRYKFHKERQFYQEQQVFNYSIRSIEPIKPIRPIRPIKPIEPIEPPFTIEPIGLIESIIWQQIKSSPFQRDGETWTPLLIFDQFEELFTLYPQPERRARFVQELADLIQERLPERLREALFEQLDAGKISPSAIAEAEKAPPLKIVFSIRSDMLHFMDELSEQIPYILRSRYQLFGLSEEQAREAVVAPAALPRGERFATEPFGYTEEALHEIIGTLTKNREVESFQLQAVCQALEEKILASGGTIQSRATAHGAIDPAFYGGTEGIERILEESYQRRLDSLENPEWKLAAARLLEDALVNENGRRRSVDVADLLARPGVTPDLLDALERQRLVRKEPRLDSFYYEISHDTLLAPIVKSRRTREAEEEKARAAAELAEQKRKAEEARRRLLVVWGLLVAAVVALFAAVWFGIQARNSEREAIVQKDQAENTLYDLQREKAQGLIRDGDSFLQNGEPAYALDKYEKALELMPGDTMILERIEQCKKILESQ